MLTKEKIIELFTALNEKLKAEETKGEVAIVGGAVMCLVFDARSATKDVDAIFKPSSKIRELAAQVGDELGVPQDWLNDGAKGFMSKDYVHQEVMVLSHLTVTAPQAEYMLAMKCISARLDTKDKDDCEFLIRRLGLASVQAVLSIVEKYYPRNQVPTKTTFFVEELIEKIPE